MFLAMLGATASVILLGRWHDASVKRVTGDLAP
jgi:hypothetical protein